MLRMVRWPKGVGHLIPRSHVIVVAQALGPSVDASPSLGLVRPLLTALFCQDYNNLVQVGIERLDEEKNQISPLLEFQRSKLTDL
jgi:hypothetical protein